MASHRRSTVFVLVAAAAALGPMFSACGGLGTLNAGPDGSVAVMDSSGGSVVDRGHLDEPFHVPDAACSVVIDTPPLLPASHVAIGTDVQYSSNPPSSGPHYPIWAAYKEFPYAVDRRYYVHDLEHGAIVLLYKCDDPAGCPDVVQALRDTRDQIPDDFLCTSQPGGPRVRVVITPDPLLDVPVAAAAWGWTYKASCVDKPSLFQFAKDHYGQGTEFTCADGQQQF